MGNNTFDYYRHQNFYHAVNLDPQCCVLKHKLKTKQSNSRVTKRE